MNSTSLRITKGGDCMTVLNLNGSVVTDEDKWFYDFLEIPSISPSDLTQALESDEEIVLNVNSPGGAVSAGQEIYTKLLQAPQSIVVNIVGQACSAASLFIMAADQINISPVGQIMIHNVSTTQSGNKGDMSKMADTLSLFDSSLANAYVKRTGMAKEEVLDLMNKETWLDADKALELGFADGVIGSEDVELVASTIPVFSHSKIEKLKNLLNGSKGFEKKENKNKLKKFGGL